MVQHNTLDNVSNRDIVQSDALAIAAQHKRCGLGISMGVGKTRIAINHLKKNYDPFFTNFNITSVLVIIKIQYILNLCTGTKDFKIS